MTCRKCTRETDHISGYCSDTCLRADHDFDAPPVTVIAANKANGFGVDLHWSIRTPVPLDQRESRRQS